MGRNNQCSVGSKRLHKRQVPCRVSATSRGEKNASDRRGGLQDDDVKGITINFY